MFRSYTGSGSSTYFLSGFSNSSSQITNDMSTVQHLYIYIYIYNTLLFQIRHTYFVPVDWRVLVAGVQLADLLEPSPCPSKSASSSSVSAYWLLKALELLALEKMMKDWEAPCTKILSDFFYACCSFILIVFSTAFILLVFPPFLFYWISFSS